MSKNQKKIIKKFEKIKKIIKKFEKIKKIKKSFQIQLLINFIQKSSFGFCLTFAFK